MCGFIVHTLLCAMFEKNFLCINIGEGVIKILQSKKHHIGLYTRRKHRRMFIGEFSKMLRILCMIGECARIFGKLVSASNTIIGKINVE